MIAVGAYSIYHNNSKLRPLTENEQKEIDNAYKNAYEHMPTTTIEFDKASNGTPYVLRIRNNQEPILVLAWHKSIKPTVKLNRYPDVKSKDAAERFLKHFNL